MRQGGDEEEDLVNEWGSSWASTPCFLWLGSLLVTTKSHCLLDTPVTLLLEPIQLFVSLKQNVRNMATFPGLWQELKRSWLNPGLLVPVRP